MPVHFGHSRRKYCGPHGPWILLRGNIPAGAGRSTTGSGQHGSAFSYLRVSLDHHSSQTLQATRGFLEVCLPASLGSNIQAVSSATLLEELAPEVGTAQ